MALGVLAGLALSLLPDPVDPPPSSPEALADYTRRLCWGAFLETGLDFFLLSLPPALPLPEEGWRAVASWNQGVVRGLVAAT